MTHTYDHASYVAVVLRENIVVYLVACDALKFFRSGSRCPLPSVMVLLQSFQYSVQH